MFVPHQALRRSSSTRQQPTEDAPVVQRLKAAGAIVLGKTTTPEFGWKGVSQSPLTGITHNPWKHGYNAGASSAGAAVILPWLVRGRLLAVDFVLASAWAAGLVAATYSALRLVHGALAGATLHGAVLGGVAAFAIVLVPSMSRTLRAGRVSARVP